jgi:hypothetical protein
MSEEALWAELLRVAKDHGRRDTPPPFEESYAAVARCLSILHRLGVEHPAAELLNRESFEPAELRDFFHRTWRLGVLHAEQRRVGQIEARGGVDMDAADFQKLRDQLADVRAMILSFAWLPEPDKRRQLDRLEALQSELQRARDDFDVALGDTDDPIRARSIDVTRPGGLNGILYRLLGIGGPPRKGPPALEHTPAAATTTTRALPGPKQG